MSAQIWRAGGIVLVAKALAGKQAIGFMLVLFLLAGWALGSRLSDAVDKEARLLADAVAPWTDQQDGLRWELTHTWSYGGGDGLESARELAKALGAGEWMQEKTGEHGLLRAETRWEQRGAEVKVTMLLAGGEPVRLTLLAQGAATDPAEIAAAVRMAKDRLAAAEKKQGRLTAVEMDAGRLAVQGVLLPGTEPDAVLAVAAQRLSAKELSRYQDAATVSRTYRTDKLSEYDVRAGVVGAENLQAALHRNTETGAMIFVLGTPVLGGDFVIN